MSLRGPTVRVQSLPQVDLDGRMKEVSPFEMSGSVMNSALGTASFGEANFGHCELGDKRRTHRLVKAADQIRYDSSGVMLLSSRFGA